MSTTCSLIVSGIFGIVGIFIGWGLTRLSKSRDNKELKKNVRLLICKEINVNKSWLESFWEEAKPKDYKDEGKQGFDEATGEIVLNGLDKMSKAQTLQFNSQMWKSQIDKTSIAFSSDELKKLIEIYQKYESIYKKYIGLQKLSFGNIYDPKEAWKAGPLYKEII